MKLHLIPLVSAFFTGCAFFVSPDPDFNITEDNLRIAFLALDEDAETQSVAFDPTTEGVRATQIVTLKNYGDVPATSITLTRATESTEFGFTGTESTYPGENGTCGTTLAVDEECTIEIYFEAATAGTYSQTFTLSYHNGLTTYDEDMPLSAEATVLGP
jgi:hypothetical protein